MNDTAKKEKLLEFAQVLKNNGFKVYAPEKYTTYCNFVKDDKIGYCEVNDWGSFNFSTVHKACRECGTGYSMHREVCPEVKMAEDCFVMAPDWANSQDFKAIRKYKNWEEYVSEPINRLLRVVEL
jgi:hypothetical protein